MDRSSPENYYSSGRNTELELCRLWSIYRRGSRQTKKTGFSTVENDHNASDSNLLFLHLPLVVGVAFAVLTVLSDVSSAPRFLVDVFSFVVHAEFEVGILQSIFISQTTDFHFANYRFSFRKLQNLYDSDSVLCFEIQISPVWAPIGQWEQCVQVSLCEGRAQGYWCEREQETVSHPECE